MRGDDVVIKVSILMDAPHAHFEHVHAENAYVLQGFYCVVEDGRLHRYPMERVKKIIEDRW